MEGGGYLPPEPGGPEPDLGTAPPPPERHPAYPPPGQVGWQQPPQGWAQQPAWGWQHQPPVPDNGSAVAGFTLSLVSSGLLVLSFGLSSVVSIVCSALGIFYGRRGKQRVDRGETPKHRGLAQAGYVIGIVSLVLAVVATVAWVLMIVVFATDDDLQRDFEDQTEAQSVAVRVLAVATRWAAAAAFA